ncbi:RHS repeat-associated core domain-containing protein [Pseudomonas sp. RGM2987]|uniref:RHS repeat domain-containing protein n=1 Tax=Pseudomonas sp. RGM2987 TaxID=2930090 RepID=UPI001FD64F4F|nr:RHS repeat-associated core domain-containing protein [Pseudomonas sp. RGM2987]MCJ8206618.1 toxin [Pseudomonas sp. RGM2987]
MSEGIHTHTPTLAVVDPRGLAVRAVAYCRSVETARPEERVNRSAYDAMGRLIEQWDPRLWALRAEDAATPANLINRYSLSGKVLGSISVDAGERISLFGDGDQLIQTWDSRGSERRVEYDALLRPVAIFEQAESEVARCTERYEYADASADFATHNQCGQVIRHDDPAGTQTLDEYALSGGVLKQTRRFLRSLEMPDWPHGLPERDVLLEPSEQAATSTTRFNPLGDVLEQVDAKGNRQLFDYTVDGLLLASHLQLSGQAASQTLVSDIAYNAYSQVEQETAGNGVVSTLTYRAEDGRLLRLYAERDADTPLQDLRYAYDPVGNMLSIEDAALPIRYFANQRVEPINRYDHDTLYQLIKATGWETGSVSRGPQFDRFPDPGAVANYQQTYHYDAGGNLLELVHIGPQSHSRKLTAARYSNRCLPDLDDRPPTEEEIATAFDGNGNLLELQPGQVMSWDLRNQLREVRPVERESGDDDRELYFYGGDGMRRRKVRCSQTNARTLITEVRYLPGLEIRTREGTGEVLQVICVQAGRSVMQVLHWETAPPFGMSNDQYRYNLTDHLGSSSLELDSDADVISREIYHPYGGTAWFAGRSEIEASYKTVRYSGKERDATGLYYYGFRYYASWLQRWINPDPLGSVDGLNLFCFVSNSPVSFIDQQGGVKFPAALISSDSIRDLVNEGRYPEALSRARAESVPDAAVVNAWVHSLIPVVDMTSMTVFQSRGNNTIYQADSDVEGVRFFIKKMQSPKESQSEAFAYEVSERLGFHFVPPTQSKAKSMIQQRVMNIKTNTQERKMLPEAAKLFYFLINEFDDNSGNQLWDAHENVYLIDHEAAFSEQKNAAFNLRTINLANIFDAERWEKFNSVSVKEWKSLIAEKYSTLSKGEANAFLRRIADTQAAVQRKIDRGELSFGIKRNFLQRTFGSKAA